MKRSTLALMAVLCGSCSKAPLPAVSPFDDPQVLAIVGEEKITKSDFERARVNRPIAPEALLDELIEHRTLVQTARERGYDRDPQHVAAVERMLANRVREGHRESQKVEVTDAEIASRYRAEQKKYTVPAKIRAAMIFVEATANFTEEKRAERRAAIEEARGKATKSPDQFPSLAAEYSYDQTTKFRGGDLGYLVEGMGAEELERPVINAAFGLKQIGDLSEIITTARGHYLVKLTEKIAASTRPLITVTPQIRATLQREKQLRFEQQMNTSMLANRRIEARRDRLPAGSPSPNTAAEPAPPTAPTLREP